VDDGCCCGRVLDECRYDRLSTRPFLSTIEKKWIVYQLFKAVTQCHSMDICHGDIKSENIMVTSWTWIVLTDFAPFKPTYLPEDDPTDFNHFFASAEHGQHRCYLAPERFYSSTAEVETPNLLDLDPSDEAARKVSSAKTWTQGSSIKRKDGPLQKSMDIFSLGCVIAEVPLLLLLAMRRRAHAVRVQGVPGWRCARLADAPPIPLRAGGRADIDADEVEQNRERACAEPGAEHAAAGPQGSARCAGVLGAL
jgi:serine/threonine protein kinase